MATLHPSVAASRRGDEVFPRTFEQEIAQRFAARIRISKGGVSGTVALEIRSKETLLRNADL
jgi:hypothetical protein